MNPRGIGGNTTSLVTLSEFTPIILASGEETLIHFFIAKGSFHTVLGRPFFLENNIRQELFYKQCEIPIYQEPYARILCISLLKPQPIGCKTGPPGEMEFFNMAKLVRNTPRKNFQNAKRDNKIMKFTKKTKGLSISPNEEELGQELKITKW
ncbi:hypothetical protein O181_092063 [Austropuccinia psidii MF-1]|uniref:Uncharacterized protein n=1 Tax=Austropuccinia psidii MF-1 TaxID=1389203 RepID=A0A9Q3P817_9BASI|nr:hypothetical protein [Austropuccinia psidii MF-1]